MGVAFRENRRGLAGSEEGRGHRRTRPLTGAAPPAGLGPRAPGGTGRDRSRDGGTGREPRGLPGGAPAPPAVGTARAAPSPNCGRGSRAGVRGPGRVPEGARAAPPQPPPQPRAREGARPGPPPGPPGGRGGGAGGGSRGGPLRPAAAPVLAGGAAAAAHRPQGPQGARARGAEGREVLEPPLAEQRSRQALSGRAAPQGEPDLGAGGVPGARERRAAPRGGRGAKGPAALPRHPGALRGAARPDLRNPGGLGGLGWPQVIQD